MDETAVSSTAPEVDSRESWLPMVVIGMGQIALSFNVGAIPMSMSGMVYSFNTPPTTLRRFAISSARASEPAARSEIRDKAPVVFAGGTPEILQLLTLKPLFLCKALPNHQWTRREKKRSVSVGCADCCADASARFVGF